MGADTKLTSVAKAKLEEGYLIDASYEELALLCGVTTQTLRNWRKEHKDYFAELETLRETPVLDARRAVVEKAKESYPNAMDYLKRKKKKEFGDTQSIEITTPKPLLDVLYDNDSNKEDTPAK